MAQTRRGDVHVNIKTDSKSSIKSMLAYAAAVTAAVLVLRKVIAVGKELEDAYLIQERAETKLRAAIMATGREYEINLNSMKEFASGLQNITTFGDEAILSAQAMLQQLANLDQEGLQRVTPAVLDFSAAMGIDLETAATLVGKSLSSSTNALTRYGIEIDMSASESEKLVQITESMTEKFGGMSQALATTAFGVKEQLGNAIGDLKEALGKTIAEGMTPFRETLKGWVIHLTEAVSKTNALSAALNALQFDKGSELEQARERLALLKEEQEAFLATRASEWKSGAQRKAEFAARIAQLENSVIPGLLRAAAGQAAVTAAEEAALVVNKRIIFSHREHKEGVEGVEHATQSLKNLYSNFVPILESISVLNINAREQAEEYTQALLDQYNVVSGLGEISSAVADTQQADAEGTAQAWIGAFGDMAAMGKKWLNFQKAAAIAQIVFNTAVAVTEALKIPIYGELKAAAIIAAGVAQSAGVLAQGVPALADGGIVRSPTLALIGERGPEAVVPLGRGGGMGGGTTVININAGMVATQMEVEAWVASIARRVG